MLSIRLAALGTSALLFLGSVAYAQAGKGGYAKITPLDAENGSITVIVPSGGGFSYKSAEFYPTNLQVKYKLQGAPGKHRTFKRWGVRVAGPDWQLSGDFAPKSNGIHTGEINLRRGHSSSKRLWLNRCREEFQKSASKQNKSWDEMRKSAWKRGITIPVTYSATMVVDDHFSPFDLTRKHQAAANIAVECIVQPNAPSAEEKADEKPARDTRPPRDKRPARDMSAVDVAEMQVGKIKLSSSASGLATGKRQHAPLATPDGADLNAYSFIPPSPQQLVPYIGAWDDQTADVETLRLRVRHDGDKPDVSSNVLFSLEFPNGEFHEINVMTPKLQPKDVHTFEIPVGFSKKQIKAATATVELSGLTYDLFAQKLVE